ncbi:MAG: hypothetical protein ABI183_26030, partial [Polyangiaceae bacterium]
ALTHALDADAQVARVLPRAAIADLTGCWRTATGYERWNFRAKGVDGLEVVRELDKSAPERDRARIPDDVLYDAATRTFGFPAAGRIHALLFVFTEQHTAKRIWLQASSFASRAPGAGYYDTGNTLELNRCH